MYTGKCVRGPAKNSVLEITLNLESNEKGGEWKDRKTKWDTITEATDGRRSMTGNNVRQQVTGVWIAPRLCGYNYAWATLSTETRATEGGRGLGKKVGERNSVVDTVSFRYPRAVQLIMLSSQVDRDKSGLGC